MINITLPVLNNKPVTKVKTILTTSGNYKLDYTMKKTKAVIGSVTLRPAYKVKDENGKVILNTCEKAGYCKKACVLEHVGNAYLPSVKDIRDAKTELLAHDPKEFFRILVKDLTLLEKRVKLEAKKTKKKKKEIFVRLNTGSDIKYEVIMPELFTMFPNIQFYDYTKHDHRRFKNLPKNYTLTYSINENSSVKEIHKIMDMGYNCAIILDTYYWQGKKDPLPETYNIGSRQFNVIDGDISDIRVNNDKFDKQGNLIGLRFKGGKKAKEEALKSGFCLKV